MPLPLRALQGGMVIHRQQRDEKTVILATECSGPQATNAPRQNRMITIFATSLRMHDPL
ncbi:hypothetical protein KX928_06630 [Roseobacter sp. YSTF-M11]|uniref:Uncharacterized protein n=1 Tax=Roseobacter insulae TaxID=2859783 RepID=A0A9X1K1G2_9RHOB|nr:hypothetical protein [Roseobacter insulae]MBW4707458.1 hypothetical protein [Roseobacter insulae]